MNTISFLKINNPPEYKSIHDMDSWLEAGAHSAEKFFEFAGITKNEQLSWEKVEFYDINNALYQGRIRVEDNPFYGQVLINPDKELQKIQQIIAEDKDALYVKRFPQGHYVVGMYALFDWMFRQIKTVQL